MIYQLSSHIKKHLLMDIRQKFLPRTLVYSMASFVSNLQTFKTDTSPKNDCNSTFQLPNLTNDISNKIYRFSESTETKKLWSKAMSRSEFNFFMDTFILGHHVYVVA